MPVQFLTPQITAFLGVNAGCLLLWFMLYVAAEFGKDVSRVRVPIIAVCWLLWAVGFALLLMNSSWQHVVLAGYWSFLGGAGWIKGRSLFADPKPSTNSLGRLLEIPVVTYVPVRDVQAVSSWYSDKFGLRRLAPAAEVPHDRAVFKFREDAQPMVLLPKDPADPRPTPVLYTRKIERVRDVLTARGVGVSEVRKDYQGTRYFEIRDIEGNLVEISEEP